MNVLLVDDEALARRRLRRLLDALDPPLAQRVDEAGDADAARLLLQQQAYDVVLLDIQMPGTDGLQLAAELQSGGSGAPAVVFVTAHEEHALQAFEHGAYDYLTKPVRAERLQLALLRVARRRGAAAPSATDETAAMLGIVERGALLRVAVGDVLYFRAQDKYTLVRTASRSHLSDLALGELEQRYAARFVRAHRSVLVAREAIVSLERAPDGADDSPDGAEWLLRLRDVDEALPVSRRQLPLLRALLRGP